MSHRRRSTMLPLQPMRRGAARMSRTALAASVSLASLLIAGALPAAAQEAGTLPGTVVLQGGRWVGAKLPTVAQGNEGLVMTIEQEQKRALLDWSRFDVAKGEEVRFEQEGVDWIALNRIFDTKPSEIAGKITAKGQVWLQNTNGIVFKDGAQVNAHTILATALPIKEEQLYNGLLSGSGGERALIRGDVANPLSAGNMGFVPRPPVGLDPNELMQTVPSPVGGEQPTVIDLIARAAIRMAILRENGMEDVDEYNSGWGLSSLPANSIKAEFGNVGLIDILESIAAGIDVSKMGDYDYSQFTNISQFWNGVSWQGVPPGSGTIPVALRNEVAAEIKAQFIDNFDALLAKTQQNYANYLANSGITVERGATLTAESSDSASPGKIMLFGPKVTNHGKLTAHDGQVLMAAGEQIKLGTNQHTSSQRGALSVAVMATGPVDSYGSFPGMPCCRPETYAAWEAAYLERADEIGMLATNTGEILADRGAVTIVGADVDQLGSILVTNGVRQRNGSIVLQASHGFTVSASSVGGNYFAGSVTLGENSVTRITPDTSDLTGLAADTFAKGKILVAGKDILLDRGSELTSRSGEIVIHASPSGVGDRGGSSVVSTDGSRQEQKGDEGSFIMREGARIDVSGLKDVERSVADNVFEVEVRSNEVSASPRQRDGILIGETVNVDRRTGATIVDWTGALAGEQRTAEQMSTEGGSVRIRASEFAIVEDGAVIDVSGGSTKYTDAEITLTRLQDATGRFHNIADADPDRVYVGIDQSTRIEQGYTEGASAGSVELLSGSARLFGKLKGDVIVGEQQVLAALGQIAGPRVPVGAVGAEYIQAAGLPGTSSALLHAGGPSYAPWSSTYHFVVADENPFTGTLWTQIAGGNSPFEESDPLLLDPMAVGTSISPDGAYADYDPETDPLWHSNGLYENGQPRWVNFIEDDFFAGMGDVTFGYGPGHQTLTINPGVSIQLAPGGSFAMGGEGGVGTIGDNVSIIVPSGSIGVGGGDGMTVGSGVSLSVAAPWINDVDAPADMLRGYVNGGEISLFEAKLTGDITLDASGGGWYQRLSPPTQTSAGTFNLIEGKGGTVNLGGGGLTVGEILDFADISMGGLAGGGELVLLAGGDVVIGPDGGSVAGAEYIDETLFRDMGVGALNLQAESIRVIEGANLLFQARNMQFSGRAYDVATGTDLREVTDLVLLPDHLRTGGTLRLGAADIVIEAGALIEVDAFGTIDLGGNLSGASAIAIDGTLRAHGGTISIGASGNAQVHLGNPALIDASGIAQTVKVPGGADGRGFWYDGRIVDGGSVYLNADYATMDAGAVIDVSGASGLLSVYAPGRYSLMKINQTIGSDAGSIELNAAGGYLLGNLRGEAGSAYNYGGTLVIGGGRDGNLLMPGYTDWQTGAVGIESVLQNIQYMFYPEPTPENPVSLRDVFTNNYSWLEGSLGFGPGDIEDIQITSVVEFMDFVRTALSPLTMQTPEDVNGAFILDPTMTELPDLPPVSTSRYALPEGYEPADMGAFERAMVFILQGVGNVQNPELLVRGARATAGANILRDMKTFDTLAIGGKLESEYKIDISSKRELMVGGGFNGMSDMSFSSRNVYLGGGFAPGQVPGEVVSGTLTISGETVQFSSQFAVGGFENVVIEAEGDMRGGYGTGSNAVPENATNTPGVLTTGNLVLRAAQIYPTTDGVLRFDAGRSIRVEQTGRRDAPLSAGGLLVLEAPKIEQAGTLRAPFGEIRLTATGVTTTDEDGVETYTPGSVSLLPGSVTSTSADGRTILYGYTYDGQNWYAPTAQPGDPELSTPPEKRVSLTGDLIDVQDGATIDVSGSGDVLGLEFVAGPKGQANVLQGEGVYAIVPAYGDGVIAPIDPLYNSSNYAEGPLGSSTEIGIGDAVWLAAFDGNPAGWYTLLPAEYALTPGGYRITLAEGMRPAVPDARELADKSFAVLGRRGVTGTSIMDQVHSTFRLERGTDVRERSEFFETYGNSFFSSERFLEGLLRSGNAYNANPRLPIDGGFLTLAANSELTLDGTILAAGMADIEGARGGIVDITSDNIVIAAPGTDVSDLEGYLVLDPAKISGIAESLLIGGIRRQGAAGLEIVVGHETREQGETERTAERSVGAENVIVRTDAANPLTGIELLFAANQQVRVESGAVVRAEGDGADAVDLAIAPSLPVRYRPNNATQVELPEEDRGGAFLRVSNLGDITVSRTNVQSVAGDMVVEAGAVLEATDSVLLDSTENTIVGNGATIRADAITAAAGLVSLGEVPQGTDGLVFTGATLEGLTQADKLTLKSYSTFDFYGDVELNLSGAAVFDGAALVSRGDAPGTVAITAGTLEIRNSDAAPIDATGAGGTLALGGTNVVIGEGDVDFAFDGATIAAGERLIFAGLGNDNFDGTLTVEAAEITGDSGAGHVVTAAGAVRLLGTGAAAELPAFASAGALLDFRGTEVEIATNVSAGSGTVRATATEGDVRLASGATIDVAGADVSFFEVQGFLPGGSVQLTSDQGDVLVDEGSLVNISGGDAGGDAGSIVLTAGRGIAVLAGTLQADVAEGYRTGSFGLTTSTLADFGGLNALLNESGFSRSRDFAILDGDVLLNGVTRVDALRIVTGTGDISVAADAVIGSDSAKGGSIILASGGDLTIADGAKFDVNAKGADQRGGSVDLQVATGGSIDAGAATIDVSGSGTGQGGQVRLRAAQTGGDVGVARWSADVTGGNTQLEAFRVYDLDDADGDAENGFLAEIVTPLQQQVIADAHAFIDANGDAIRARLGQAGNASFSIVPGIELRSEGDIELIDNWNFKDARFEGRGGVLTLRAGGDLIINANLSDGFFNATPTPDAVTPTGLPSNWRPGDPGLPDLPEQDFTNDDSWSYNLVAGADFVQTNVLATQAGSGGNIEIGGLVRTGTGDINIAASGDMNYEQASIVQYLGGDFGNRPAATIVVPAGTPIVAGTVLKPTTYQSIGAGEITLYPTLPAGTVLRRGTQVPAGTVMPDGSTLAVDTVLAEDVTFTAETVFPGEVVIASRTYLGGDLTWVMPDQRTQDPTASAQQAIPVSIAGLGDVVVNVVVGNQGSSAITLPDGRRYVSDYQWGGEFAMRYGSIYTVGVEDGPVANYTDKTHVGFTNSNAAGVVANRSFMKGGGDISVNVGGGITASNAIFEDYTWMLASGAAPATALFGYNYNGVDPEAFFNTEIEQFQPDRTGQTGLSLLGDRFLQGIGALGGGDVSIISGGDVDNLLVALPVWVRVAGGTADVPQKTLHLSGGGDLVMNVGQNLKGGLVQVGKGQAMIDVAGSVIATEQQTIITQGNNSELANSTFLHLALDDARLNLQAGGDVHLRGVSSMLGVRARPAWLGYTQDTSVRITSLGGDISYYTQGQYTMNVLPSQTAFVATAGSVNLGVKDVTSERVMVDMWPDTRFDVLAQQDVNFRLPEDYQGAGFIIGFSDPLWVPRAINPGPDFYGTGMFSSLATQDYLTGNWNFNQAGPGFGIGGSNVHSGSDSYSRIYAAQGNMIGWRTGTNDWTPGNDMHKGEVTFGHETRLKAGGDIRMGAMTFITHDGSDVPVIEAGGSIYLPNAVLYGPGRLWVQAGDEIWMGRTEGAGIRAREAYSTIETAVPLSGGSITALAGIDQAPEYQAFFDYYLDPESVGEAPSWLRQYFVDGEREGLTVSTPVVLADGQTQTTVYAIELVNYMRSLRGEELIETEAPDEVSGSRPITRGALAAEIDPAEYAEALAAFKALDPVLQRPLAIRILNAELKTAGREAVGRSPETDGRYVRQGDPTRGYDAIGRLFPGAQRRPGEALAEGEHSWTGNIEMMVSQIRGESGGDVDLVVPGGSVQLASLSISNTSPGTAGIVTQRGGGVNAITYGDYIVNQSRTMTADDGDILIWSSYGNIDAGRGRKTSLSVPPVAFPTDAWGTTRVQLSGLPNGAGIATLDQVDGKQGGDVDLYAFNGIVNAGDAGIRASRDLFVGALEIRGLDNITVGGETNVDLGTEEGTVGPLNVENFAQAAEDEALARAFDMAAEVEKLRTVRQTILTGSVVSFGTDDCVETDTVRCP